MSLTRPPIVAGPISRNRRLEITDANVGGADRGVGDIRGAGVGVGERGTPTVASSAIGVGVGTWAEIPQTISNNSKQETQKPRRDLKLLIILYSPRKTVILDSTEEIQ